MKVNNRFRSEFKVSGSDPWKNPNISSMKSDLIIGTGLRRASAFPFVANGFLEGFHASFCYDHKMVINRKSNDLTLLHGSSGPDITTPLVSTDATHIYAVDVCGVDETFLKLALNEWAKYPKGSTVHINGHEQSVEAVIAAAHIKRLRTGCWFIEFVNSIYERLIVLELKYLGIKKEDIEISKNNNGDLQMKFSWAYPGHKPKMRTITFIDADITRPEQYRVALDAKPDVFYQKCALSCLKSMYDYLPHIARATGSFMLMSPISFDDTIGDGIYTEHDVSKCLRLTKAPKFRKLSGISDLYRDYWTIDKVLNNKHKNVSPGTVRYFRQIELWQRLSS